MYVWNKGNCYLRNLWDGNHTFPEILLPFNKKKSSIYYLREFNVNEQETRAIVAGKLLGSETEATVIQTTDYRMTGKMEEYRVHPFMDHNW